MFKRIMDVAVSMLAIIILLPIWLIIAVCIFIEDRQPVFFRQERLGRKGQRFILFKFRSMYVNQVPPLELGAIKHAHPLVTKIGYWIRRTKLDETPQFINVLLGNMSLVGPRPCLPGRLQTMSALQMKRLDCRPGLTGWAEINGNVELTWEEQVLLDLWYVEHRSFTLDILIFFKTILVVLLGSNRNEKALAAAKNLLVKHTIQNEKC